METQHRIVFGDARSMSKLQGKSVHLIITSPPYWQLKDYGVSGQIGFDDSYEAYVNNLNLVWQECGRVLKDGCRMCINIGDQFARSVYYGRYKIIPIRTEIIRFCEHIGFDFMGSIIWQKVTTCNTTGGASVMGSFPYPRNGIVKLDYEFVLLFKKQGKQPAVPRSVKEAAGMTKEEWNTYFSGHWNFPGDRQEQHIAVFPEELPRRLIKMFSFPGETVLDPFAGSGTTSVTAARLGRHSIGYEINSEFQPVIESKWQERLGLFKAGEFTFDSDSSRPTPEALDSVPYVFRDPLMFDKKLDPRKLKFGSRVTSSDSGSRGDHLYRVQKVIAPDLVELEGNLIVKLLGVCPIRNDEVHATSFLERMFKGTRVYLRFDNIKHDSENRLLAYLYLKNRTFVNARLIREGLCTPETGIRYKHRERFEKLAAENSGAPHES